MMLFIFLIFSISCKASYSYSPCTESGSDVVFLIDASESIVKKDFIMAKQFIINSMTFIIETNQTNRIAYVVFGNEANIYFNFTKYAKLEDMIKVVNDTPNEYGITAIGKALNLTLVELVPTMRESVNKLVVILTDGTNNIYPAPYVYANLLKEAHVKITAIGIGEDVNKNELTKIASPGSLFSFSSFSEVFRQSKPISRNLCPSRCGKLKNTCETKILDLVILLDSSGSINLKDFGQAKEFIKNLFQKIDLGVNKTRIALISFSDTIRYDVDFDVVDRNEILSKVESIERIDGTTGIGLALRETHKILFPKRRPNIPFNVLLITDGCNNMYPQPESEAKSLKDDGANIITLGIGEDVNIVELNSISSQAKVLTVDSFDDLMSGLKSLLKIITCDN